MANLTNLSPIRDHLGRPLKDLRISVMDRCNFRCIYCMPEEKFHSGFNFLKSSERLSFDEILRVTKLFTDLGVSKIRITGGEPLLRVNLTELIGDLSTLKKIEDIALTTNGVLLKKYSEELKACGLNRITVSLDSIDPEQFRKMSGGRGNLETVLEGIDTALSVGFKKLKINSVILKNRNHDEVIDLVNFAIDRKIDISFIEEMPLGIIDEHNRNEVYYSSDQIRNDLECSHELIPTAISTGGPSRYYKIIDTETKVGFISPHSHNFCSQCNRVRLTAEGQLLLCLGQEHSVSLKKIIRKFPGDIEELKNAIRNAMDIKPKGHEFDLSEKPIIFRHMNVTGG